MKTDFSRYINYRAPLAHTYKKLVADKEINIVYFGGSITAGFGSSDADKLSWRAKTDQWFNAKFPHCKINSINSSIGESGTYLGVFRTERDVISQKPDLLFIEYAINDLSHEATRDSAAMQLETIVREVKAVLPCCDIVIVLTEAESTYMDELLYPAAQGHEDVAIHYSLSSVHAGKALAAYLRQNAGKDWSDYFIDTVHPNDDGYGFYYDCVEEYLHNSLISSVPSEQSHADTVPMLGSQLLDGQRNYITDCSIFLPDSRGFKYSGDVYMNLQATPYVGYVYTDNPESELCICFYGTELGIYTNFSHYLFSGDVEVSVNNGDFKAVTCSAHNPTLLVKDLPEGNYYVKIRPVFTDKTPDVFKIAAVFTRNNAVATRKVTKPADKNEFFAMPTRDIAGSAANPDTHKYQLCENDIMVRRIYIDTPKGGEDIDLMLLADTHLNHLNVEDFEEKNPVVLSTNEYRLGFKGHSTFLNLEAVMEYASLFDKTIVLGDVIDYLTRGSLEYVERYIYDKCPDALLAVGGHDITRKMQGKVKDEESLESRYEILAKTWRNDLFYHSEVIGDKALLVVINNGEHKYHAFQAEKLAADVERARRENLIILLFQHEQLCTHNPKDRYVNHIWTGDPNVSHNFCDGSGYLCNDKSDEATMAVYDIIRSSADVIKGIFCGHHHSDCNTEIKAYFTHNGIKKDAVIPQYVVNGVPYDKGHIMIVTIR